MITVDVKFNGCNFFMIKNVFIKTARHHRNTADV